MNSIIIPIKTNNMRLPGKNTMNLGKKPLYQYIFDTVKKCKDLEVFIDSSDESIIKIARDNNFKVIVRNPNLNGPDTSGNDLILNALPHIHSELVGQFFVTTPFLKAKTIERAFEKIEKEKADSCFGLYPVYDRFWMDDCPVNHSFRELVGTQFMNPLMREAGFYIFRKSTFLKERSRICGKYTTFKVDPRECVDIDTADDFSFAETLVAKGLV